jgi:hypothetical protein
MVLGDARPDRRSWDEKGLTGECGGIDRYPKPDEFPQADEIEIRFGSLKRAFALVKRATGTAERNAITRRGTDLEIRATFDREAGATRGARGRFRTIGAHRHVARHAVGCAESGRPDVMA